MAKSSASAKPEEQAMRLLHIDASITGAASATAPLSAAIVNELRRALPGLEVVRRDLNRDPVPHLDSTSIGSVRPDLGRAGADEAALSAGLVEEFLGADIVVIGAPMYNFSIPSQLKAWFDRIIVAGKTFRYTEKGAEGLARGKKVIVASARGGLYANGGPAAAYDFHEPYLRTLFGLIGVTDLEFVLAEGLALGPAQREASVAAALQRAAAIAAALTPAEAA
jgi:FMN-dependent NADH-azoreductase